MIKHSHQQFLDRYSAALPVAVKARIDAPRLTIEYEIRGPALSVKHEIGRIVDLLAVMPADVKWTACFGPPQWVREAESVSFGEIYVPREAENFWQAVSKER